MMDMSYISVMYGCILLYDHFLQVLWLLLILWFNTDS
jgi:hypothetical protein